jgi:hypothetical protein
LASENSPSNSPKKSFAAAAKYAMGKPTYNAMDGLGPAYQTSSSFSLIYDISSIQEIPDNQVISSIGL